MTRYNQYRLVKTAKPRKRKKTLDDWAELFGVIALGSFCVIILLSAGLMLWDQMAYCYDYWSPIDSKYEVNQKERSREATRLMKIAIARKDSLDAIFTVPQFFPCDTIFSGSFTFSAK